MATPRLASIIFFGVLVFSLAPPSCDPDDPLKVACRDHNDCTEGRLCARISGGAPMCTDAALVTDGSASAVDGGVVLIPPVVCGDVWEPATFTEASQVAPLLIGRWRKCGGAEPVNLPSPFEFTDDGKWHLLTVQGDGSYMRRNGFGQAGTYELPSAKDLLIRFNNAPGSSLSSNLGFQPDPLIMQWGPGLYTRLP